MPAYHSHHMLPLAPLYEQALQLARVSHLVPSTNTQCEMFSSVTRSKLSPSQCTPEYWKQNMISTVRFSAAVTEATIAHDIDSFIEIGPHPALKGPTTDTLAAFGKVEVNYLSSCVRNKDDFISMLEAASAMINVNLPITCRNINALEMVDGTNVDFQVGKVLTDLPRYQRDHSASYWAESRLSQNHRFRTFPRHQLLGARSGNDTPLNLSWRNLFMLKEIDWLKDLIVR